MDFFSTTISLDAINNVNQLLLSTMLSAGKQAKAFEDALQQKYRFPNPVTLNSGTVTMFLALTALGVKRGDKVILPAQTFIATGQVILQCGAIPVFADINPKTGNIDVNSIKSKITNNTKAIIPVHWGGYPCDLDEINQLGKKHNIPIIEDAAHAFGSTYKGQNIGTISDFTSFSFQAIKHLTTGDGGLLTCQDYTISNKIKRLRWFDIDRENSNPSILGEREYDAVDVGYKAHMNDLSASIGLGNLKKIDSKLFYIQEIANRYRKGLNDVPGLQLMLYESDRQSSYWLFPVLVENRLDFINKLQSKGIPTSVVHLGIDKNRVFGSKDESLIGQRFFDEHQIHIPIHDNLTFEDVDQIISTIKQGW